MKQDGAACILSASGWLGGMLTNFKTMRSRVRRMEKIERMEESGEFALLPKKEVIKLKHEHEKTQQELRRYP